MQTRETEVWFPAKKYGWGWGLPCRWQGWVVMAVWLALMSGGSILLVPRHLVFFVAYVTGLGVVLFIIALLKGEKPRWRWGEDEDGKTHSAADRLAELEELHHRRLVSDTEYETRRREILKEM